MNSYYKLNFNTDKGEVFSFKIPDADIELDESVVNTTMNAFISANAFISEKGNLISKKSAELVSTVSTGYNIN